MRQSQFRTIQTAFLLMAVSVVAACSGCVQAPVAPKNVEQSVIYAKATADASVRVATQLLSDGTITADQAAKVSDAVHLVKSAMVVADAALASGNQGSAQAQLDTVASSLSLLETFLASHKGAP